jgi:hypothetical protein
VKTIIILLALIFIASPANALEDAIQMQRLIETSQAQLKTAQDLLVQARQDSSSLDRAAGVLDQLAKGIDQQIQPLQGTSAYNQAILKLQAEKSGATQVGAAAQPRETEEQAQSRQNLNQLQQQSQRANLDDLTRHEQISQALIKAQPGFVPKLQAQAELGQWQTNVRISAQLTELLASIQGLRQELRGSRGDMPEGFGLFLSGAAEQSKKMQHEVSRVP